MPVDSKHREYATSQDKWKRCRDAFNGGDAVKAAREGYLPKLAKQKPEAYNAYLKRALFYGATGRTVQGLTGMIFRKPPSVVVPEEMTTHLSDITLTGIPFTAFAMTVLEEILVTGRFGVLLDMSDQPVPDIRPYWAGFSAEQIVNWRTVRRGGDYVLSLVVLLEWAETAKADDLYEIEFIPQYRVIELLEEIYTVTVWRKNEKTKKWDIVSLERPLRRGEFLNFIPFCFFGSTSITPTVGKPPLLDLVDVNLSHYRTSADLEHGRHFTALPTPWTAGVKGEDGPLEIGSGTAWRFEDSQAKAGMLEFTGQGLSALEKALHEKEQMMAAIGARILEEPRKGIEAAETLRLRNSGEQSVLKTLANTISLGLTKLSRWHAWWMGWADAPDNDVASVALNTDFIDTRLDPQELTALIALYQAGRLSRETLYYNLERGEMTRPGASFEEEEQLIAADDLALPGLPPLN